MKRNWDFNEHEVEWRQFAAAALTGIFANQSMLDELVHRDRQATQQAALEADAMIEELKKRLFLPEEEA